MKKFTNDFYYYVIIIGFLLLLWFCVSGCNKPTYIPVSDTDEEVQLQVIRAGSHQYLYGSTRGVVGRMLCHYEDCDNPMHHPNKQPLNQNIMDYRLIMPHLLDPPKGYKPYISRMVYDRMSDTDKAMYISL